MAYQPYHLMKHALRVISRLVLLAVLTACVVPPTPATNPEQSVPADRATIEDNTVYQQLVVYQEGRAIFLDTSGATDMAGPALLFSRVLSLPVVFDELVPQLADAVDGTN